METKITQFTDLYAWQQGHVLVLLTYKITKTFPKSEVFNLVSQMQRSAVSVTSNIAEGFGRRTYREKTYFYYISHGSLIELKNQYIIARDIGYITADAYNSVCEQLTIVHKLINGLIKKTKEL